VTTSGDGEFVPVLLVRPKTLMEIRDRGTGPRQHQPAFGGMTPK